jgi:hypothetical protein
MLTLNCHGCISSGSGRVQHPTERNITVDNRSRCLVEGDGHREYLVWSPPLPATVFITVNLPALYSF